MHNFIIGDWELRDLKNWSPWSNTCVWMWTRNQRRALLLRISLTDRGVVTIWSQEYVKVGEWTSIQKINNKTSNYINKATNNFLQTSQTSFCGNIIVDKIQDRWLKHTNYMIVNNLHVQRTRLYKWEVKLKQVIFKKSTGQTISLSQRQVFWMYT